MCTLYTYFTYVMKVKTTDTVILILTQLDLPFFFPL